MKIIIRQFQRQTLGGLKRSKTKLRKGKAEAAKGSQLLSDNKERNVTGDQHAEFNNRLEPG